MYVLQTFRLTSGAIQKDVEIVAQQAIEFWSTVCDVESQILEENEEVFVCFIS